MNVLGQAQQAAERALERARGLIRRGVLQLEASYFCGVEAHDGETFNDVELWQQFGLASRPPAGGEILLALVGGRGEGAIGVATTDRAHRPTGLAAGDAMLYGAASGSDQAQVATRADGDIDVFPATPTDKVNIGTQGVEAMLLGATFDTALRALVTTPVSGLAAAFAALATACTDAGTGLTAISTYGGFSSDQKSKLSTAGGSMTAAGTALAGTAALFTTFLGGSYLATQGRVS